MLVSQRNSPKYQKVQLENGAVLVMEANPHVRTVSVGVWVKMGSSLEKSTSNGISHFLEHMVFKGTQKRNSLEIATVLESLGGELNAFTDREVTCYHATVLSEHVGVALDVLSDLTLHPTFPKLEIDLEKRVLLQELAMVEESPEDQVYDLFFKSVWKDQPLGQPVIGTRANIESFNRAKALQFFRRYYHPSNMVISIAGNIDSQEIQDQCETLFAATHQKSDLLAPLSQTVRYVSAHKKSTIPTDQLHLVVGFEGLSLHDEERFEALVLNFYLGGGMSSRLFQQIRERAGLAYTVDCDFIPFSVAGLCAIYLALKPKSLGQCLKILGAEIQEVVHTPISAKALAQIQSQIKGSVILSSESMDARQESLGRNEIFFGRHITPEEIVAEVEKVTPERVQKVAQRLFVPEKETTVTLSRTKPKQKEVSIFL